MQLFFMIPFRQTASTSMGLNNLKPAATEGIYIHFFFRLSLLAQSWSVTTKRSCNEQDTEETEGSWGDVECNGTDMLLSTSKILRRPLRYTWLGLSFIRNLSCSGGWSFCYSETKEWKGLNKMSLLGGLWIS